MNVIPKEVLLELKKLSDGVSKQSRSWYEIVQEYIVNTKVKDTLVFLRMKLKNYTIKMFLTDTFQTDVIPYFWMLNLLKQKTQVLEHLNYMPIR